MKNIELTNPLSFPQSLASSIFYGLTLYPTYPRISYALHFLNNFRFLPARIKNIGVRAGTLNRKVGMLSQEFRAQCFYFFNFQIFFQAAQPLKIYLR